MYGDAGDPPTLQTDGRTDRPTDGRHAIAQDCALHYSTSRGKTKTKYWYRRYYRYCRYCIIIDITEAVFSVHKRSIIDLTVKFDTYIKICSGIARFSP